MRLSRTLAVVVLFAIGCLRPFLCQVQHGSAISGPSITSMVLEKHSDEIQPVLESKEQIVSLRRQEIDYDADCEDYEYMPGYNADTIVKEMVVKGPVKPGHSIAGPSITASILKKYNLKPQPVPEKKNQTAATLYEDRPEKAKHRPVIPGPQITSEILKKHNIVPESKEQTISPRPQVTDMGAANEITTGTNTDEIQNENSQKDNDQRYNETDSDNNDNNKYNVEKETFKDKGTLDEGLGSVDDRFDNNKTKAPMGSKSEENVEQNSNIEKEDNANDGELPKDIYTYVTLIEITFKNSDKKYRSGTVIHDRVVITAAHCLQDSTTRNNKIELSLSFVVIGTKMAHERGLQHYLPIENIRIHPEHKGWNADLALVYTFAGIKSNNYGFPIPIVGHEPVTTDTSILLVISWDKCKTNKKNRLVVKEFKGVNEKCCKNVVTEIMPSKHKTSNSNTFLCYSSLETYLTRSDAGAPVIQGGKLVAVTAGAIETDGKHFGVGLKMSCFCTWIAQNLPDGGDKLNCCKDYCGSRNRCRRSLRRGLQSNNARSKKHRNKVLFNIRFQGDMDGFADFGED